MTQKMLPNSYWTLKWFRKLLIFHFIFWKNHHPSNHKSYIWYITGNLRRFRRICEHTQSVVSVVRRQPLPPASPRAARRNSTNKEQTLQPRPPSRSSQIPTPIGGSTRNTTGAGHEVSDSSSCNSDVSHGLEQNKNGPSEVVGGDRHHERTAASSASASTSASTEQTVATAKATTIATPKVMEGHCG